MLNVWKQRVGGVLLLSVCLILASCGASEDSKKTKKTYEEGFIKGRKQGWDEGFDRGWEARGDNFPDFSNNWTYGLQKAKKIKIIVDTEGDIKFDEVFRNLLEVKLRSAGIDVIAKDVSGEADGVIDVWYRIVKKTDGNFMHRAKIGYSTKLYSFGEDKGKRVINDVLATPWDKDEEISFENANPKQEIKEYLEDGINDFINHWLKENKN